MSFGRLCDRQTDITCCAGVCPCQAHTAHAVPSAGARPAARAPLANGRARLLRAKGGQAGGQGVAGGQVDRQEGVQEAAAQAPACLEEVTAWVAAAMLRRVAGRVLGRLVGPQLVEVGGAGARRNRGLELGLQLPPLQLGPVDGPMGVWGGVGEKE